MSDELEYFSEFLEDPSAPGLNEYFRMLRRWFIYITEHKHEFNYLEDDEWKEIRERILDDLDDRIDDKDELQIKFKELNDEIVDDDRDGSLEFIEMLKVRLRFMKNYQYVFDIPAEDIADFELKIEGCLAAWADTQFAEYDARIVKIDLEQAIANLDDHLVEHYQRTGKLTIFPWYKQKKSYKGN